jgi:predicted nuclease of predicted toxin-antitoxin system
MIRFVADENFDNDILRGVRLIVPDFDVVRVQDTEIYQADDPIVLEWATKEGRVLLTHDVKTMPDYAYERLRASLPMIGVLVIRQSTAISVAIEAIALITVASDVDEWNEKVTYLPL